MGKLRKLTREEGQATTRIRLLAAARTLFGRDGYAMTSVERIAEKAGYSKGAAYSNFPSKEAIFLEVLEAQGQKGLASLIAGIERADDARTVCSLLVDWANNRSRSGNWSLTILEYARYAGRGSDGLRKQEQVLRDRWSQLGEALLARFPRLGAVTDALTLGALLYEIAYAPAITFIDKPTAGDLMNLAVESLLREVNEMPDLRLKRGGVDEAKGLPEAIAKR